MPAQLWLRLCAAPVSADKQTYIHIQYTDIHTRIFTYMYMCVYIHTFTYMYTYINIQAVHVHPHLHFS